MVVFILGCTCTRMDMFLIICRCKRYGTVLSQLVFNSTVPLRTGIAVHVRPLIMQDFFRFKMGSFHKRQKKHNLMRLRTEQLYHRFFLPPV